MGEKTQERPSLPPEALKRLWRFASSVGTVRGVTLPSEVKKNWKAEKPRAPRSRESQGRRR